MSGTKVGIANASTQTALTYVPAALYEILPVAPAPKQVK